MGWSIYVYKEPYSENFDWFNTKEITGGHWSYSSTSDYVENLPDELQNIWYTQRISDKDGYLHYITTEQAKIIHDAFKDFKTKDWHHENLLYLLSKTIESSGHMRWS